MFELLKDAAAPVAIVGGADWSPRASHHFANFAFRYGIPVAAAFRRQDAICNSCQVYAGNLGYGPNPKLQQRIRDADLILAVGPRLGEATTDGYTLITPDHPGQTLVHVHPDPNELGRVYHADLPICADMGEFAEMIDEWIDPDLVRFSCGEEAHAEWLEWSEPKPRDGVKLDLGPCVAAMRERLPENTIICNGAGNFSGWWHRYWRYGPMPTQLAPTSGTMGYGLPAAVAAALRFKDRPVVCVAGDGDFLMNGQELATAAQYGADLLVILVDNGSYGTIRMHQEREYPERISATELNNPDFAALARAYGGWAETVETTEDFAPALDRAMEQQGHPPAPLQDRRRADQQRDHDLEAARALILFAEQRAVARRGGFSDAALGHEFVRRWAGSGTRPGHELVLGKREAELHHRGGRELFEQAFKIVEIARLDRLSVQHPITSTISMHRAGSSLRVVPNRTRLSVGRAARQALVERPREFEVVAPDMVGPADPAGWLRIGRLLRSAFGKCNAGRAGSGELVRGNRDSPSPLTPWPVASNRVDQFLLPNQSRSHRRPPGN